MKISDTDIDELFAVVAQVADTDNIDISVIESQLTLNRFFGLLNQRPTFEAIAIFTDFLGVRQSEVNLNEFLDEVSRNLDDDTVQIDRIKVGRIVSRFFDLLKHYQSVEQLQVAAIMLDRNKSFKNSKPRSRKKTTTNKS